MPSKLEIIGINERSGLVTPNLYKQNWVTPNNTTDNYSVLHTRALSDTTTPIYGKGTGIFLDTTHGGGDYDINGNVNYAGSGRLNAILINTASWSYGPATPYSVTNTRALSDSNTPIYGKGTGLFLDTAHGGGDYDINGNIDYVGSGRLNAIGINTAQWSYGPATPYSVTNTRALSDSITPVYGKGTGIFLDTANGGGSYDINGNQTNFPGSGRVPLMNYNYAIWTIGPTDTYKVTHPHALRPNIIPTATNLLISEGGVGDVHGKGNLDGNAVGIDGTLPAHSDYAGGSYDDIISRDRSIQTFGNYYWVNVINPSDTTNWYTVSHTRAISDSITPEHGKGTLSSTNLDQANEFVLPAHTNYGGGSSDDIGARNNNILNPYNLYWVDTTAPNNTTNWYTLSNNKSQAPTTSPVLGDIIGGGDNRGKGTTDSTLLNSSNEFVLPAHTNYRGGNWDDIVSRNNNIRNPNNLYWVDVTSPNSTTNWYTMSNPNAQADNDDKGKGTNDGIGLDGTYNAHTNYAGGNYTDRYGNQSLFPGSGRNASNVNNVATNSANKPFGYGFNIGESYTAPPCDGPGVNVGTVFYL